MLQRTLHLIRLVYPSAVRISVAFTGSDHQAGILDKNILPQLIHIVERNYLNLSLHIIYSIYSRAGVTNLF